MGIDLKYFNNFSRAVKPLLDPKNELKAAFLSYPDLLITEEEAVYHFNFLDRSQFVYRSDSEQIKKFHSIARPGKILETKDFMRKIGINSYFFDYKIIRGDEIVCDLNDPIESTFCGVFDLAIDSGTMEHCFNFGVAFTNMCKLVKVGGG